MSAFHPAHQEYQDLLGTPQDCSKQSLKIQPPMEPPLLTLGASFVSLSQEENILQSSPLLSPPHYYYYYYNMFISFHKVDTTSPGLNHKPKVFQKCFLEKVWHG